MSNPRDFDDQDAEERLPEPRPETPVPTPPNSYQEALARRKAMPGKTPLEQRATEVAEALHKHLCEKGYPVTKNPNGAIETGNFTIEGVPLSVSYYKGTVKVSTSKHGLHFHLIEHGETTPISRINEKISKWLFDQIAGNS